MQNEITIKFKSVNEVIHLPAYGGLYGFFGPSGHDILNKKIRVSNAQGWRAVGIVTETRPNGLILFLRIVLLIFTFFIFTFEDGYYVLIEKSYEKKVEEKLKASLFV